MTENVRNAFKVGAALGNISSPRKGNSTSDNNRFLRIWQEVCFNRVGLNLTSYCNDFRWIPYNKGGGFLKWYGHNTYLIDWQDKGSAIREIPTAVIANEALFFKPGLTWGTVTSKHFSIRWFGRGYIFDNGGCCVFGAGELRLYLMALLNSAVFPKIIGSINPTLNFQSGDVSKFPVITKYSIKSQIDANASTLLGFGKLDWNAYERSWEFESLPILTAPSNAKSTLESSYRTWITENRDTIAEMQRLEEENNRPLHRRLWTGRRTNPRSPHRANHPHGKPGLSLRWQTHGRGTVGPLPAGHHERVGFLRYRLHDGPL